MSKSIEKKPLVSFNDSQNEMTTKNKTKRKERSISVSETSTTSLSSATLLTASIVEGECSISTSTSFEFEKSFVKEEDNISSFDESDYFSSFTILRLKYLFVNLVVMLADGLQGTHLYVLYDGYGFDVASLYALGFITGAITTPITGPLIDRFGRKRSAMLYCALEMWINLLEQYPFLSGLLVSRMVGGITTNLLSSVFESWLDTEFRNRSHALASFGTDTSTINDDDTTTTTASDIMRAEEDEGNLDKNQYELIMRDSVIVSNLASIASGYLAHILAEKYGSVGPFQGAVTCTGIALVVISMLWTENYGVRSHEEDGGVETEGSGSLERRTTKSVMDYIKEAIVIFRSDSKILWLGIIQGLSTGSLQIFIFLWSPTLNSFASNNINIRSRTRNSGGDGRDALLPTLFSWAVDGVGDPAYGLIFGAFMAAGVSGGLCAPYLRRAVGRIFSNKEDASEQDIVIVKTEGPNDRPIELEFLIGANYMVSALLVLVPPFLSTSSPESFPIALAAFLMYEFLVGLNMPCEGVIRSLYLPSDARATMTMVPRMVVNLAVSLGVLLTRYISEQSVFIAIALLMTCSGVLQLSFITRQEWSMVRRRSIRSAYRLSSLSIESTWSIKQCDNQMDGFPNKSGDMRISSKKPKLD